MHGSTMPRGAVYQESEFGEGLKRSAALTKPIPGASRRPGQTRNRRDFLRKD